MRLITRYRPLVLLLFTFSVLAAHSQTLELVDREYRPDARFPQLYPYVIGGWRLRADLGISRRDGTDVPIGATIRLVVRNTSDRPINVSEITLAGKLIKDAGEDVGDPIWFQVRPNPIPPGAFAQVTVRLRHPPAMDACPLELRNDRSLASATVDTKTSAPLKIAAVNFNAAIDRMYVYVRSPGEFAIARIELDGEAMALPPDAPQHSSSGFVPLEVALVKPWPRGSFHAIRITTDTGATATEVIRARDDFFALGMWGYRRDGNGVDEQAANTARAFAAYLFNTHMRMAGNQSDFFVLEPGLKLLESLGMRVLSRDPTHDDLRTDRVYARFLFDEPDAHDASVKELPPTRRLGAHAQQIVQTQQDWTNKDPRNLCLLNVDNTYTPDNWLTYGPLPDVLAIDPYWNERLKAFMEKHPERVADTVTPMYVFGAADIARFAAEPHPTHAILNSTSYRDKDQPPARYPTPAEKRIEFYMALAAGAKGISYWWWTPYGQCFGAGSREPAAVAMMNEIATLNAEAQAVSPLLAIAAPAANAGELSDPFVATKPYWLLARTLCVGSNSAVVILVNRDTASDRLGSVYQPIEKATLTIKPPAWLASKPLRAYRLRDMQLTDVSIASDAKAMQVVLDHVELGEMLLLTKDPQTAVKIREQLDALRPRLARVIANPP
jgi:hypothetical protein